MVTKCPRYDGILAQATKNLWIGIGTGSAIGCLLVFLYYAKRWYRFPRLQHTLGTTKNNDAASKGHELGAIQKKSPLPPRRAVDNQPSNSTTASYADRDERDHRYQHEIQKLPGRGEAQQRGGNMASTSAYNNRDPAHLLPNEYQDDDICVYVDLNSSSLYQQNDEVSDRFRNYSNNNPYPGRHNNEPTYADEEPSYANIGNDYEQVVPFNGAQAWISNQPQTEHGYLYMGNVPHQR